MNPNLRKDSVTLNAVEKSFTKLEWCEFHFSSSLNKNVCAMEIYLVNQGIVQQHFDGSHNRRYIDLLLTLSLAASRRWAGSIYFHRFRAAHLNVVEPLALSIQLFAVQNRAFEAGDSEHKLNSFHKF